MDNFRMWAFWRRTIYGGSFLLFWVAVGTLTYYLNFTVPPTCFDGILNGSEVEVDAGGTCVQIPSSQVISPEVVWAQSFEITPGQYNAVGYIENRNVVAGAPNMRYTFTFRNESGDIITERNGTTVLPPNSAYPVFEGRVFTDGQVIAQTELVLEPADLWLPATNDSSQFVTLDIDLQDVDERPRLDVTLQNDALTAAEDIEVVATIFNDGGTAVAASETFIENFAARDTQDIVFTWPNSIAKTVRSCSIPTDVILGIDLSGSMNNDQDNPPQPVTDALAAASSFIENLGINDQIGVVTFATEGSLVQPLTDLHVGAAAIVEGLTIAPESEVGFTNTSAAIELAAAELVSSRHDVNARRAFVMLTDGLPTAEDDSSDPEAEAVAAARAMSVDGADVYAIGLGDNVNQQFIRSLASTESNAYLVPDRSDLDQIYSAITASLCEVGPTKIEVIAKTPTNFAPLR